MKFKPGDIVRYTGEKIPMTVVFHEKELGVETVCCVYLDDEKKEVCIRTQPGALESVPKNVLKRLDHIKNRSGLKSYIEDHPLIVYGSAIIATIGICFSVFKAYIELNNKELITKGSYILIQDVNKSYVDKVEYDKLKNEINRVLTQDDSYIDKNDKISELIEIFSKKRDDARNGLEDIRSRNSPLTKTDKVVVSAEEQDKLNQIDDLNNQINQLTDKLNKK